MPYRSHELLNPPLLHRTQPIALRGMRPYDVHAVAVALAVSVSGLSACSGEAPDTGARRGTGGSGSGNTGVDSGIDGSGVDGTSGGIVLNVTGGSVGGITSAGDGGANVWPSPACQNAPIIAEAGEYCQGPAYSPSTSGNTLHNDSGCGSTLWGVARDFVGYAEVASEPPGMPHPDFGSHYCCGNPLGTVLDTLGADAKPVYNPANVAGDYSAGGVGLTGPEAFEQWYNDTPGVNQAYLVGFHLVPAADGISRVFASKLYFPVDNVGFGNFDDYGEDGQNHNFGFTTELHTKFKYQGGEVFSFEGDDDLWVFIDNKLAIDIGGIHVATPATVNLDEFAAEQGLVVGQVYSLDLFNAERHPGGSNFKITTSLAFVDCGVFPQPR